MSYSFLLVSGSANTPTVPVGATYNGQTAVLHRKNATLDSTGVVANGKATFTIPADRVTEFAGNYTVTVGSSVVQQGDIDVLTKPGSSGGGTGNVDLSNYPTKGEVNVTVVSAVSAKADKTYVDNQLAQKAAAADLASKVSASDLKPVALSGVFADLTGKPDLTQYATNSSLAAKVDKSYVDTQLADKANAADVASSLATKANAASLGLKADKTYVDSALVNKAEVTALAAKADITAVYVKTEIDNKLTGLSAVAPANAMVVVAHGSNGATPRPTGASSVYWLGSAEPVNMTSFDLWNDGVSNPPSALTLNGSGGNASATFTVNGGDNATDFKLYAGSTATGTPVATSFPATINGLTNGTPATFVATASNSMGSVTSNTVTVTPQSLAATILDRGWTTAAQTSARGTAPGIVDPSSVFYIGYFSNAQALSIYATAIDTTTSTKYYGYAPNPAPAGAKVSSMITMRSRATTFTPLFPRAVVAAPDAVASSNTFSCYSAYFGTASGATSVGKWRIVKTVNGTDTALVLSAADIPFPSFPMDVQLNYDPATGLLELFTGGSTTPTLTFTDPSPLTGRYAGFAFATTASDPYASDDQAITRLVVKSY